MERSLIRIGDDYAVEIDQTMLDLLRITPQTPLEMTAQGDTIVVTPVRECKHEGATSANDKTG